MLSIGLIIIVFFAGFTQAALGFGFGLIFVSVGSLLFQVKEIIPLSFIIGVLMDLFLVINTYKDRPTRSFNDLVFMGVIGAPIGLFLFITIDQHIFEPILGIFLIFAITILFFKRFRIIHNAITKIFSGFITGVFGSLFGIAGPFISIYLLSDETLTRRQNIFVMNTFFVGISLVAFLYYLFTGAYSDISIIDILILILATIFGSAAGLYLGNFLSKELYRYLVFFLIFISGILLIIP